MSRSASARLRRIKENSCSMRSMTSIKGAAPSESYQSDFRVGVVEMWGSSAHGENRD